MKKLFLAPLALALVPLAVCADEHEGEEAKPTYVMATYYHCKQAREDEADAFFAEKYAPVFAAAQESGTIVGWGWMAHRVGGKWRRLMHFSAEGIDQLLDAAEHIYGAMAEAAGDESTVMDSCPSHDDYIWEVGAGNAAETRGAVAFSVYLDCDSGREERADEIVAENLAPIMDGLVENGSIASWGWLEHYVGGKARRLLTTTAASHKASLKARDHVVEVFYAEDNAAGAEFGSICSNHVDYMWDNQLPE